MISQKVLLKIGAFSLWVLIFIVIFINYGANDVAQNAVYSQQTGIINSKLLHDGQLEAQKNEEDFLWHPIEASDDNETQLLKLLQLELHNIPFLHLQRARYGLLRKNPKCAVHPALSDLNLHNNYWQLYHNANLSYALFGAYYDERINERRGTVVRILAMIDSYNLNESLPQSYCQLWYEFLTKPFIVPVVQHKLAWHKEWDAAANHLMPYMLTCIVPTQLKLLIPQAVSLVATKCENATNSLRIINERPQMPEHKHSFAICVKGLDFIHLDISTRLVEWLELMRQLGAHKIFFYILSAHKNIRKVLAYYEREGLVDVRPLTLADGAASTPHFQHELLRSQLLRKRLNEVIPYNDCFYRNIYKYDYIAAVDIDEVIMPLGNLTHWSNLTSVVDTAVAKHNKMCPHGFPAICFRNLIFPINPEIASYTSAVPNYMFMLQHTQRLQNYSELTYATKCFYNTSDALLLHNHYPMAWLKGCRPLNMGLQYAHLQHYHLLKNSSSWQELLEDRSIWRFKQDLIDRVGKVLRALGLV